MKFVIAACLCLLTLPAFAQAEPAISGATVPVIHTDRPAPAENPSKTIPLPPQQSAAEIAADQALRKQADTDVTDYAEKVSDNCDADFKARIDWTTISPLQTHRYNPADACGAALQALDQLCTNPAGKQRVQNQIKSVVCTTGEQPSIEMHAGTLVYTIDWQSADPGTKVYAWLASHL